MSPFQCKELEFGNRVWFVAVRLAPFLGNSMLCSLFWLNVPVNVDTKFQIIQEYQLYPLQLLLTPLASIKLVSFWRKTRCVLPASL